MNKKDKLILGGIAAVGIGAAAYLLFKKSNSQQSGSSSSSSNSSSSSSSLSSGSGSTTQPSSSSGLQITNYSVSIQPCIQTITVKGTVLYNGNPVPSGTAVQIGFCSAFDPSTNTFNASVTTYTDSNGNFSNNELATSTGAGGQNCVLALVQYNNQTATAKQTATVPQCGNPIIFPVF